MIVDDILVNYVRAANQKDFSVAITLNVNGALVTGKTVSASQYLQEISEKFDGGNDIAQLFSERLAETSEHAAQQDSEDLQYIHLKDAQVYNGDQHPTPSKAKFLWRGKLAEVDGFFLGTISNEQ